MSVFIYVEGDTEVFALPRLLADVYASRRVKRPIPLHGSRFLKMIGKTAGEILAKRCDAHVFACPDLAPKESYRTTSWAYEDYQGLQEVLRREVRRELRARGGAKQVEAVMARFHPYPFRHDFEVLLLAMPERLRSYLRTKETIETQYRHRSPEDQDFDRYPKTVVGFLFEKLLRRRYDPPEDYRRIVEYATDGDVEGIVGCCPCFAAFFSALRQCASA